MIGTLPTLSQAPCLEVCLHFVQACIYLSQIAYGFLQGSGALTVHWSKEHMSGLHLSVLKPN